jgi:membrane protease YdiL (CAAX protease family)
LPTILFVWRKNIYVSILMHLLNNFFAYIIYPIFINSY